MEKFDPAITCIQLQLSRVQEGLEIFVRTSNKLEGFFKNLAEGMTETFDTRLNAKYWTPKNKDNFLKLYALPEGAGFNKIILVNHPGITGYRLDAPGRRIIEPGMKDESFVVNLSFLRAVGISEGGVHFTVKGVFSENQVKDIYDAISNAASLFYSHYLSPMNLTINLIES